MRVEVCTEFQAQASAVGDMERSCAGGDFERALSLAHLLKGSAAVLGLPEVVAACQRLRQLPLEHEAWAGRLRELNMAMAAPLAVMEEVMAQTRGRVLCGA